MDGVRRTSWANRLRLGEWRLVETNPPSWEWRINLLRAGWSRKLIVSRPAQFLARAVLLAGFVFTILAGLLGSPVGSHNFAIIMVWIAWWSILKLGLIPLAGRAWCSVCPIPLAGEWLQRGGLQASGSRGAGLNLPWPKKLRGAWLQIGGFLLIGLFSAITLTDARLTSWIFLGLLAAATVMGVVFERRAFCSYVCPIGGFSGMYAKTAPIELRVNDASVCAAHREKACYRVCPWGLYPLALRDSAQCGLCMECVRACDYDNIAINLRPFGTDLVKSGTAKPESSRLDEAILALVMIGSALSFAAVFTGPWGSLKTAAYEVGTPAWWLYGGLFLVLCLLALPGAFALAVWVGKRWSGDQRSIRRLVASQAQALLPLGLLAWMAFTISFAAPKATTVIAVLSDPLGFGWKLLGQAPASGFIAGAGTSALVQAGLLLVGLAWSTNISRRLATAGGQPALRMASPVMVFCLGVTLAMLYLLVG